MYFNTLGDVVACCKNQTFVLGNIAEQRLDEIWNGARIGVLRKALANYQFAAGCDFCEWQIAAGDHHGVYTRIFEEFPATDQVPQWPSMMEFAASNTCNLECIMCYGELSSSIRANRDHLPALRKVCGEPFFEDLKRYLPHLRAAKFLGGEPFLSHECFRVMELMVELGLKTPVHVTTNGTQWNPRVERILEKLPVSLSISIDGATKETVEKIRVNAKFEDLMANLGRFHAYTKRRGTGLSLTYCLMPQNWHEFGDYLVMGEERGLEVFVNTVIDPPNCSLFMLPPEELRAIVKKLEAQQEKLLPKLRRNRAIWLDRLEALRKNAEERLSVNVADVKERAREARLEGAEKFRHHESIAWQLVAQGRLQEALEEVLKTPETHPLYFQVLVQTAHIRRLMKDVEGCQRDLDRALSMTKGRPETYHELGWLRLEQGQHAEALKHAEYAWSLLAMRPDLEGSLCDLLGFAYARNGRFEEANRSFERFIRLRPADPLPLIHRGWAYHMIGKPNEAIADADAALKLAPTNAEAKQLRDAATASLPA
jgi:MoaA/NifB/PqqE/SkfB family radical SAM enzyme